MKLKDIPGIILSSLGALSLLYGKLDLGHGLEILVEYYSQFRDILFYPLQLIGIKITGLYKDLILIVALFYSSAIRTKQVDAKFSGLCYFGSIIMFFPFVFLTIQIAKSATFFSEYYPNIISDLHWLIIIIITLVFAIIALFLILIQLTTLIGGYSIFFWFLVLIFPPSHNLIKVLNYLFARLSKLLDLKIVKRIPEIIHLPGLILNKIISLFLPQHSLSQTEFISLTTRYFSSNLKSKLKEYYIWLGKQILWVLVTLLLFKIIFDTFID